MTDILKIVFSLSLSGSLLILVLFLCKPFYKNRISKRWQYYIWLVVIARLLLPFAPKQNLMGTLFEGVEHAVGESGRIYDVEFEAEDGIFLETAGKTEEKGIDRILEEIKVEEETAGWMPAEGSDMASNSVEAASSTGDQILPYLWLVWLGVAAFLLMRKVTMYQSFVKCIKAGREEVSDTKWLNLLAEIEEEMGIKHPVELYTNSLVSSPLLLGLFYPCIILPGTDLPEEDFRYTVRHELIHYRHCDLLYKWLVQITVCLHWFNPLVRLMAKETGRACELACDEALIRALDKEERMAYGDTLIRAMEYGKKGACGKAAVSITLSENGEALKERLKAIMHFKKQSKLMMVMSLVFAAGIMLGAVLTGAVLTGSGTSEKQLGESDDEEIWDNNEVTEDISEEVFMETLNFDGTEYYLVFDEEQLRAVGKGKYGLDKHYLQQADIQLSADEWIPIGTKDDPFTGSYNGNGYEIIGLTMTNPDAKLVGMFGVAREAHIYNITLRDYDIMSAGRNVTGCSVGAIAAITRGESGDGCRIYDNVVYPKDDAGMIPDDVRDMDENEALLWKENVGTGEADARDTGSGKALSGEKDSRIEEFYEKENLPGFARAFAVLDEASQKAWFEKIYKDDEIAFFSAGLSEIDRNSHLIGIFAEKAYQDGKINFFSVLTDYMEKDMLETWLDKAKMDRQSGFQLVLLTALDRDWEAEALEEKLDRQREEEYRSVGVIREGKRYYYQGQTVNIFYDRYPNNAFYTLNMNPDGTVNIKIVRDADGKIIRAEYMTEEEVEEMIVR